MLCNPLIVHTYLRYASKNVLKMVRSVCVARRQRFPKNGVKWSVLFRSTVRFVPFRRSSTPGFLATGPDSINFAKNLVIPRRVALIPFCCNFRDISPDRPWRWWYIYNHLLRVIAVRLRHRNTTEPTTSVSLVAVTTMDVASTYMCTYILHVTTKTEARRYRLNASSKRNETENGNKTEENANGHTVLRTCSGNKTNNFSKHTVYIYVCISYVHNFVFVGAPCIKWHQRATQSWLN